MNFETARPESPGFDHVQPALEAIWKKRKRCRNGVDEDGMFRAKRGVGAELFVDLPAGRIGFLDQDVDLERHQHLCRDRVGRRMNALRSDEHELALAADSPE